MPARHDHGSETTEAGGESLPEPLVDRQLELDLLRQHIARVTGTGTGHAVLILGESGVGKSRLAVEAAAEARKRGMAVISVRCLGRGAEPLLPLKEAEKDRLKDRASENDARFFMPIRRHRDEFLHIP